MNNPHPMGVGRNARRVGVSQSVADELAEVRRNHRAETAKRSGDGIRMNGDQTYKTLRHYARDVPFRRFAATTQKYTLNKVYKSVGYGSLGAKRSPKRCRRQRFGWGNKIFNYIPCDIAKPARALPDLPGNPVSLTPWAWAGLSRPLTRSRSDCDLKSHSITDAEIVSDGGYPPKQGPRVKSAPLCLTILLSFERAKTEPNQWAWGSGGW